MRTMLHFPFPAPVTAGDAFTLNMPAGAIIQRLDLHLSQPVIWAEVDDQAAWGPRNFVTVGTGQPLEPKAVYIGSFPKGMDMVHVYEPGASAWTDWAGGDGPPDGTYGKVVDIMPPGAVHDPRAGCDATLWTGPAAAADWSAPCRYRISAEQPAE